MFRRMFILALGVPLLGIVTSCQHPCGSRPRFFSSIHRENSGITQGSPSGVCSSCPEPVAGIPVSGNMNSGPAVLIGPGRGVYPDVPGTELPMPATNGLIPPPNIPVPTTPPAATPTPAPAPPPSEPGAGMLPPPKFGIPVGTNR